MPAEAKEGTVPVIVEVKPELFRAVFPVSKGALESVRGVPARLGAEEVRRRLESEEEAAVHFDAPVRTGEVHAKAQRRKGRKEEGSSPFLEVIGADQMHRWGLEAKTIRQGGWEWEPRKIVRGVRYYRFYREME